MRKGTRSFFSRDVHRLIQIEPPKLPEYLKQTAAHLDLELPLEYVARGDALAIVNQDDSLCGGVVVITNGPFRSLKSIPDSQATSATSSISLSETAEINGLWLAPEMKSPFLSFTFWRLVIGHLLSTEKQNFLFTFDNSNKRMRSLAYWLKPTVLYSGSTKTLPGMKRPGEETIASISIEPLRVFLEMLERRGKGKSSEGEQEIVNRLGLRSRRQTA